jgi:hypothetical protein
VTAPSTAVHLVRRFANSLPRRPPHPDDERWALDLLTPAEKARRGSIRADESVGMDSVSKYGSPIGTSPSRWAPVHGAGASTRRVTTPRPMPTGRSTAW